MAPRPAQAQAVHAYGVLGAGPSVLAAGVDCLVAGGPVGIRGDIGLLAMALGISYHVPERRPRRPLDVFTTAGYFSFSDLNNADVGVSLGAGVVYWRHRRVGYLVDGFGVVPIKEDILTPHRHWGVRGGIAITLG
jgi:hypothetical protein